jgi:hypothetical protein
LRHVDIINVPENTDIAASKGGTDAVENGGEKDAENAGVSFIATGVKRRNRA